jgi:hypothetical protein
MKLGDLIPSLRPFGNPCWFKEHHASQGAAEAHLRHLRAIGKLKNEQTANTYHCAHCGAWHVGHSSRQGD